MSSSMDLNNNLIKNPRVTESLNVDSNRNHTTICKESLIIYSRNQHPLSSGKAFGQGHTVDPEIFYRKPNVKINTTNGVLQNRERSVSNKDPATIVNFTTKPNLAANDVYGNIDSNGNRLTNGNYITQDNWQTHGNSHTNTHHTIGNIITNGNHQTSGNIITNGNYQTSGNIITNGHYQTSGNHITNGNHFSQSDSLNFSLNEEIVLPYLNDIIKELPELSINQVSEVLSSLEDDDASGKIDTPLLDSKQVYQVLSNFNPEFLPFPFQYMDLLHSNDFSMPRRYLKNSTTDTVGNTYHQDAPDRTKINHNLSPEPQNHVAKVTELPSSTSVQDLIIDTHNQPVGPPKSEGSNIYEKMTSLNVQRSNTDSSVQKNVPCACSVTKTSQSNFRTKETMKVKRNDARPRESRIPIKIGKVKSNRKNDTKTDLQKGTKISNGPKLGPESSHLGTPSLKSFTTPKPYKCEDCLKTFTRLKSFTRHLKIHLQKCLHVCNVCKKSFQTKNHLYNHTKTHKKHKSETKSKSFETKKKIAKRRKTESAGRKCEICEKEFSCASNLKRHSQIHTRAKTESNESSCKSVSRKGNVKKPVKVKLCCKFCLKQFQFEKSFHNHVRKCVKK